MCEGKVIVQGVMRENRQQRVELELHSKQYVTSSPYSRHVGVQRDRSSYGDLHEMSDILIMLLICVELDKISLLHKLKQLYKGLPVGFFNRYRTYCK